MKNMDTTKSINILGQGFADSLVPPSESADAGTRTDAQPVPALRLLAHVSGQRPPVRKSWQEQARLAGAVSGLLGGLAASVLGGLFVAASWLVHNAPVRSWLSTSGTVLLCLTIPLLLLGAVCLDWLETKGHPRRLRIVPVETRSISHDQQERG